MFGSVAHDKRESCFGNHGDAWYHRNPGARLPAMSIRNAVTTLVSTLLMLGAVVACADDDQSAELNKDFAGREFVFDGATGFTPVDSTTVQLSFQNSTLLCYAGCNMLKGSYSELAGTLVVDELRASTTGCTEGVATQDQWLRDFFMKDPRFALEGDRLALISSDATLTFREAAPEQGSDQ